MENTNIGENWNIIWGYNNKVNINFDKVLDLCNKIANQIKNDNKQYRSIVGIAYGGIIPASIISYKLKIKDLIIFDPKTEDTFRKIYPYLIVDDVCDTGITFELITNKCNLPSFDSAALFYKEWSTIKPTYIGETIDLWVCFPWEN